MTLARRVRGARRLPAMVSLCLGLAVVAVSPAAAQYPQPLAEAPETPGFMSRYNFHLDAAGLGSGDPTRFQWATRWGGDFDLVDYVFGRFGFLADYHAILGNEFQPFDPNQSNYTLEFSTSVRLGRNELAAVFHHVSRHLGDRPKRVTVANNVAEARWLRRFQPSGLTSIDVKAEGGPVITRAYVDYNWIGKLDVTARRQFSPRTGAYGRVLLEAYGTDEEIAGRGWQRGGRFEAGVRLKGTGGAIDLFAGWEQMVDADLFDRQPRSWPFAGFRLVN